jgi:hypothetical protein
VGIGTVTVRVTVSVMDPEPPHGWIELLTTNDWKVMSGKGGVLIISDTANEGPIYHDRGCPLADRSHFIQKVVDARSVGVTPNGRYFWAARARVAAEGGARACEHPADPLNLY